MRLSPAVELPIRLPISTEAVLNSVDAWKQWLKVSKGSRVPWGVSATTYNVLRIFSKNG